MTPTTAKNLTTFAVYEIGKNNPKLTSYMRVVQPPTCLVAGQDGATFEDVVGEIENTQEGTAETKAAVNVILSLFQTATAPQGTNSAAIRPYLKAVFCEGWADGLALLPDPSSPNWKRNALPKLPGGMWWMLK